MKTSQAVVLALFGQIPSIKTTKITSRVAVKDDIDPRITLTDFKVFQDSERQNLLHDSKRSIDSLNSDIAQLKSTNLKDIRSLQQASKRLDQEESQIKIEQDQIKQQIHQRQVDE